MAIIWSLMPIRNAVVLEYGPAGTTHFGGGLYSSFGLELGKTLFTTHISEDDVIMGDVSRLENAIREIDEAYHPKIIFVVAAAVIAVIGTDIAGVCQYMQDEVNARLISFEEGGFRGDYTYGLRSVYRMLAKEVIQPAPRSVPQSTTNKKKTYNIFGASAGSFRIRSDVWEIQNLMREAFGWECGCTLGLECDIHDIEAMGDAALNLVLRSEAVEAAEIVEKNCGTPWYYGAPYGYVGTLNWLEHIAQIIGEPINPALMARLKEKTLRLTPMGGPMGMGMMGRTKPKVSMQADYDTLLGFRQAALEMELQVENMVCSHSLKAIDGPDAQVQFISKEKDRIELFRNLKGQWCMGSDEMGRFCREADFFTLISAPFHSKLQQATHLPFMGEKGMDYLVELKNEFFDKFNY
jgi:nitrogenase molybdenum-cofactor synthesis protein NifE